MKVTEVAPDGVILYYEIRNDAGMCLGTVHENLAPFEGCQPVTMEDAKNNAELWASAPDMHAILTVYTDTAQVIFYRDEYKFTPSCRNTFSHEDWENVLRGARLLGDRKEFVNDLENYLNE